MRPFTGPGDAQQLIDKADLSEPAAAIHIADLVTLGGFRRDDGGTFLSFTSYSNLAVGAVPEPPSGVLLAVAGAATMIGLGRRGRPSLARVPERVGSDSR